MRRLLKTVGTFALAPILTAGVAFGREDVAEVRQLGDANDSEVRQTGNADAIILQGVTGGEDRGYFSFSAEVQSGNSFARVDQDGSSDAFVIQQGGGQFAGLLGKGDHSATVAQTGNGHDADLEQYGFIINPAFGRLFGGPGGNKAEITQEDRGNNSAELRQLVGENKAYIIQTGSGNVFEDEVPTAFSLPGQSGPSTSRVQTTFWS